MTAQHMVLEMDAGDIIDVEKTPIGENDTAGEVLDRLAELGANLLSRVLSRAKCGDKCCGKPQCCEDVTFAPMLDKSMSEAEAGGFIAKTIAELEAYE